MAGDSTSLLLSAAAVIVAIWSVREAKAQARRQDEIQRRLLSLENSRERDRLRSTRSAELRARIERGGRSDHLVIFNEGSAEARAIDAKLLGKPLSPDVDVLVADGEVARTLGPGSSARYVIALHMGSPPLMPVELAWEDDTGEPRTWRSDLKW